MRFTFFVLFFCLVEGVCAQNTSVEKKPIEVEGATTQTVYTYTDGSTKSGGFGVKYQWRYVGETGWGSVGKKGKLLAPVLNQYESSAKLYRQSKNLFTFGVPAGYVVAGGGIIMMMSGRGAKEEYNPETDAFEKDKNAKKRVIAGAGMMFAGCGIISVSFYGGKNKFEASILEYNKRVSNDSGALNRSSFHLGVVSYGLGEGSGLRLQFRF